MLLGLQAAGEDIGQPRQLGQSHHPLDRRIGDMRLAVERHHVMFALRGKFDVADQHEIIIARSLAKGAVEYFRRTLMIALIELVEGLDHPARRIQQALAGGVFADIAEQDLNSVLGFGARRARLVRADRGGQKFGWVQLGRAAFRNLRFRLFCVRRLDIRRPAVRSFAWAEGFDQCVHVNSVRPVSNGPECHRQTGRPGRRTPESHNPNT